MNQPEPAEALRQNRSMSCLTLASLTYGVFLYAGLKPGFWEETDDYVNYHTYATLPIAAGTRMFIADPELPRQKMGGSESLRRAHPSPNLVQYEVSPLQFLANYHMDRAYGNFNNEPPTIRFGHQREEFDTAERYAPDFYAVHSGRHLWIQQLPLPSEERRRLSAPHLQKAITFQPRIAAFLK